jgi:hypothetical protein
MHAVLNTKSNPPKVEPSIDYFVGPQYTPRQPGEVTRYETHAGIITIDDPPSTMQGLMVFFDKCVGLAGSKDALYRKAWQKQGYMGNLARIMSKAERLRAMAWGDTLGDPPSDETLRDTLMDMANLCGFMARNLEDGNRWGD